LKTIDVIADVNMFVCLTACDQAGQYDI